MLTWQQHQDKFERYCCHCLFICCCWTSCSALVAGRLLVGLGIGASAIVVPAYLAEIAPAKNRGMVVQMYEVGDAGDALTKGYSYAGPIPKLMFVHIWVFLHCCRSCTLAGSTPLLLPLYCLFVYHASSPLLLIACPTTAAPCHT